MSTVKDMKIYKDDILNRSAHINHLILQMSNLSDLFYKLRNYINMDTLNQNQIKSYQQGYFMYVLLQFGI